MTRGTLVYVEKDGNGATGYKSIEFNGDMYPSYYGQEVMDFMKESHNHKKFITNVRNFNDRHFLYEEGGEVTKMDLGFMEVNHLCLPVIDLSNYYKEWGSDYIYIKNNYVDYIFIQTSNGDLYTLENGACCGFCFGEPYDNEDCEISLNEGLELFKYGEESTQTIEKMKDDAGISDCKIHCIIKVPDVCMDKENLYSDLEDLIANYFENSDIELEEIIDIEEV